MERTDAEFTNALRDGDRVVGNWLPIGRSKVAETNGIVGFDFALVDSERTATNFETVEDATAGD